MGLVGFEPCWKFKSNTVRQQLIHILGELHEAAEANHEGDQEALAEEIADVMVACDTLLQVQLGMSNNEVWRLICKVNEKNQVRGYHEREAD